MIAVDTNIVVRLIVRDDPVQLDKARRLVAAGPVYLSLPCLMEVAWVLRKRYDRSASAVETALTKLFDAADIVLEAPDLVEWALRRAADGADFADMILLVAARECERFATFDRAVPRDAAGAPVPVELLS